MHLPRLFRNLKTFKLNASQLSLLVNIGTHHNIYHLSDHDKGVSVINALLFVGRQSFFMVDMYLTTTSWCISFTRRLFFFFLEIYFLLARLLCIEIVYWVDIQLIFKQSYLRNSCGLGHINFQVVYSACLSFKNSSLELMVTIWYSSGSNPDLSVWVWIECVSIVILCLEK